MESIKIDSQGVARLDDYRRGARMPPTNDSGEYQNFVSDLSKLADCLLGAAEILSRIKPPRQ